MSRKMPPPEWNSNLQFQSTRKSMPKPNHQRKSRIIQYLKMLENIPEMFPSLKMIATKFSRRIFLQSANKFQSYLYLILQSFPTTTMWMAYPGMPDHPLSSLPASNPFEYRHRLRGTRPLTYTFSFFTNLASVEDSSDEDLDPATLPNSTPGYAGGISSQLRLEKITENDFIETCKVCKRKFRIPCTKYRKSLFTRSMATEVYDLPYTYCIENERESSSGIAQNTPKR